MRPGPQGAAIFMGAQDHGRHLKLPLILGLRMPQTSDVLVPAVGIGARSCIKSILKGGGCSADRGLVGRAKAQG